MRPRNATSISWLFSTVHFQIINLYLYLHLYFYLRPPIDSPLPFLDLKLNRNSKCVALPPWTIWQICISPLFFISFPPLLAFLHWVSLFPFPSWTIWHLSSLLFAPVFSSSFFLLSFFSIFNLAKMHQALLYSLLHFRTFFLILSFFFNLQFGKYASFSFILYFISAPVLVPGQYLAGAALCVFYWFSLFAK